MKRRDFIKYSATTPLVAAASHMGFAQARQHGQLDEQHAATVKLFVAGDVMTGRGIDQILPHSGDPQIFEPHSRSALDYVRLAEQVNGPIPMNVDYAWIWGDVLEVLDAAAPDAGIINLETAITSGGSPWPQKGIQYRMHPANIPCLTVSAVDCCVLANNHVLDWGYAGFAETLASLEQAGLSGPGAGANRAKAQEPAVLALRGPGRVLVFAAGLRSSGIPPRWAATRERPGINLLPELSNQTLHEITRAVNTHRQTGDLVVFSLHWGGNWGYAIPTEHIRFAHALIDEAGVDLVHGHSSHHPLGMEVHRGKPIIYGCGDLIDDYEGIRGHREYRIELALLYLVTLDRLRGELVSLEMVPMRRCRFRLNRANLDDTDWLRKTLDRESRLLGARVRKSGNATLSLAWT